MQESGLSHEKEKKDEMKSQQAKTAGDTCKKLAYKSDQGNR